MTTYLHKTITAPTPQNEPLRGKNMVKNAAGGYVFAVNNFTKLERFLVLGTEGGTYYVGERKLTNENIDGVIAAIKEDGVRAVHTIRDFSVDGRIPKESTALFSLALCFAHGDLLARQMAEQAFNDIVRTGRHILEFVSYMDELRSWGRLVRRAVGNWYMRKPPNGIAFDTLKYRNRSKWSHRDVLRSAHIKPREGYDPLFKYLVKGYNEIPSTEWLPNIVNVFEEVQKISQSDSDIRTIVKEVSDLIRRQKLPREMIPSELLKNVEIWDALSESMPPMALIRNLANLTRLGVIKPMSPKVSDVVARLTDETELKKARIHPLNALNAQMNYRAGYSARTGEHWDPIAQITSALEQTFYKSFKYVESSGKRLYLAVDVSGSMARGSIAGIPGFTPCMAAATMALTLAKSEPNYYIRGFASKNRGTYWRRTNEGNFMIDLDITDADTLDSASKKAIMNNFGMTDAALPMLDALEKNLEVDAFVVLTDGESWKGEIHAVEALRKYRKSTGIPAKLVAMAFTATNYSLADPTDAGMLDVVGYDANAPKIVSDFVTN